MQTAERIGEGPLLDVYDAPRRLSRDIGLVGKARRKGWIRDPDKLQEVSDRLIEIALTTPQEDIAVKAAAELRQMVAQDLSEDARGQPEQVEHHHTHDIGPVTESNIEAQRAIRLARLAGRV